MRILVVNDDGIASPGLARLARCAAALGETWVAAPAGQCSGMSQRITVFGSLEVREAPAFPVEGVHAISVGGTPADCVRAALALLPEKPDVVFSGINSGYNVGRDIQYSGTVGAAAEGLLSGIPAIAFSAGVADPRVTEAHLPRIARELLAQPAPAGAIWNVNFPDCAPEQLRGILTDRFPSDLPCYQFTFTPAPLPDGGTELLLSSQLAAQAEPGSDIEAILQNYISIGPVNCDRRCARRSAQA